ncbi:MAG: hypothetical protein J7604_18195 [Sporocytophaga sp.]|uniref:hypothetical protein n=1 Tax=Sporocytophaga sp. TaxID=2231183 RepID=UPI001B1024F4|nr:hypothetical protein [Sporocytophaga sp.]MBO9702146.1 hypothetical protein [Sporocytophaga sp.]
MNTLQCPIKVAGLMQIILVAGSLLIPKLLNWKKELSIVAPLIRQMFWTYAGYILMTNLSFGVLSFFAPEALSDHSLLAAAVSLFIALYWAARILIQFFYFDRASAPKGWIYFWGEVGLVAMFVFFAFSYLWVFYSNIS